MTRRHFIQSLASIPASACFGGFAIPAFAASARKVALVVGNAAYASTERLKNPVADATLTANTLRKLGFHTSLATDRNTAQLKADLDAFGQAARGADIAVFFYAGHGIAVENINYLLAVDQKLATATSLDMKRQGISLRWIESLLRQDMGVSVIVVDACRNPLLRGVPQQGMAAAPRAARGMLTFYSTAPGALARDGTGANSDFSAVFNRHLARPDLSLKQIVEATQRDVSAETGDTQVPWVSSGLVGDAHLASTEQVGVAASAPTSSVGVGRKRGDTDTPPPIVPVRFWNENLAQLEEQVQFAVMNFDINSKRVLEQRAAAGDAMALTILGSVYAAPVTPKTRATRSTYGLEAQTTPRGNGVVPADPARAVRYLAKAAERRFPLAQTLLAELLVEAPRGVPRDFQRAENLLQDAAATGYGRARLDLLDLKMRRGNMQPRDLLENGKTLEAYIESFQPPKR